MSFMRKFPGLLPGLLVISLLVVTLSACKPSAPPATPEVTPSLIAVPTPSLTPSPLPTSTPKPAQPEDTARDYLDAWSAFDYAFMYSLLTSDSQSNISLEDYTRHYQSVEIEAALTSLACEVISTDQQENLAQVRYRVQMHSALAGDFQDETLMNLAFDGGQWRVKWEDTLVHSQLAGLNYMKMDRDGYIPVRANIYDRNGTPLASNDQVVGIGFRTAFYDYENPGAQLETIARLTRQPVEAVQRQVENAINQGVEYIPLGEFQAQGTNTNRLSNIPGIEWSLYQGRFYPVNGIAPHVVGYVGQMGEAEVAAYKEKGFRKDELVGKAGLEQWGEELLNGKRGGALYVRDAQGRSVNLLAETTPIPSEAITTTLDFTLQDGLQRSLQGFRGAAVVLERDTGRVLGIASSPGFDPNAFNSGNNNSYWKLLELSDPAQPLYNRATQGQYPLGSVFKIITMAAALESGRFTQESTYECGYFFEELQGVRLNDWTWDRFQKDDQTQPSGLLTLPQGLIRSCNPFFWHIGLDLYRAGLPNAISDMARGFGFASPTGIESIAELPGQVPDPPTDFDGLNVAIGQSELLVSPLQVANSVAAVGNGGTLYAPRLVEQVGVDGSTPAYNLEPVEIGKLPVSQENLALIQKAMLGVTTSVNPRGTGYYAFTGLRIPVAGKTGTATSGSGLPHAWFAGYTVANNPNKPDIAFAVIVENVGDGSEYAAPISRRIVELYFLGRPARLFPWESGYYVEKTPEPEEIPTETPEP